MRRRVLNLAFGPAQVHALTEVFVDKSSQLRDCLLAEVSKNGGVSAQVDAHLWLSRATLDIVGLAGFGSDFESLTLAGKNNELSKAMVTLFIAPRARGTQIIAFLQATSPLLRLIVRFSALLAV